MKFGKEFKRQKVPEWMEAYVDYNGLKHILQEIRRHKQNKRPPSPLRAQQRLSLHRAFTGLNPQSGSVQSMGDVEDQVIAADNVQQENSIRLCNTKILLSPEGYREVFLLNSGLAMLALGTFLVHVHIKMESKSQDQRTNVEFIPIGLITVIFIIMCCPFNIIYRSSRLFLIKSLFRCICAPLYKVTLPDDFLADQLTNQVQAIRCFEYYICYYTWERFSQTPKNCLSRDIYTIFYFIMAVIPYWLRFLQCLRRLFEEKDYSHAYNALRYLLTTIAIVIRTASQLRKKLVWRVLAIVSSAIATLSNTYWDIVVDWGLLQWKSKNFFLRDRLLVSQKTVYFVAMVLDVLLRFAWLQLVLMTINLQSLRGNTILSIFSCLEILRRGIWNFFRLENEHLNNVGKYRAFKSVPLPFKYTDEPEDKDE